MNTVRVGLLLLALTVLFLLVGAWLGGTTGMIIALGLALAMNFAGYWYSDRIVLRMAHAEPLTRYEAPDLYRTLDRLAARAGIPTPRLYLAPDPQPNAFATGRSPRRGVVAVNEGLLRLLSDREIEGVLAHEIAHIKHRDTLTMAVAASLAGAVMTLVDLAQWALLFGVGAADEDDEQPNPFVFLVALLVAPLAALLIQLGVSRTREFAADHTAASLTGSPGGLISALLKLDRQAQLVPALAAQPATAHLWIVSPLRGSSGGIGSLAKLFMTHPPVEERVERLRALAGPRTASAFSTPVAAAV